MKALVTGGAGFVGSHLVEYLAQNGVQVRIFDSTDKNKFFDFDLSRWDVRRGHIEDYTALFQAAQGYDVIFHLAGVLGTDYLVPQAKLAVQSNIMGTLNVLDVARLTGALVVYFSLLPDWLNSYMITKNAAAKFCQMYFQEFGVRTVVLRGVHIYGPRQKWAPVRKAVPYFIVSALRNQPLEVYGSGNQLMDLLHVNDAVTGIARAAQVPAAIGRSIQFGSGIGVKVVDLAQKIIELCGSSSEIHINGPRPGEPDTPTAFVPANTRQQTELLDFAPTLSLDEGLKMTIDWYRKALSKSNGS